MTSATAQAFSNIVFIQYWGIVTEKIVFVLRFLHNFRILKTGELATLVALPPVIILPISYFVFKERVGWQAILGTVGAIVGVAVLFLV